MQNDYFSNCLYTSLDSLHAGSGSYLQNRIRDSIFQGTGFLCISGQVALPDLPPLTEGTKTPDNDTRM